MWERTRLVSILVISLIAMLLLGMTEIQAQQISPYDPKIYQQNIQQLYQTVADSHSHSFYQRLLADSSYFLGRPYSLYANGEGPTAQFDQGPLYRTDKFDCVTYVNTVIALASSNNVEQFTQNIQQLNYVDGKVSFVNRNHFTSVDYNINNQKKGFFTDITSTIVDKKGKPLYKTQQITINKAIWFQQLSPERLRLSIVLSPKEEAQRLEALRAEGQDSKPRHEKITYIPLSALFNDSDEANIVAFNQIPAGALLEIVRPIQITSHHQSDDKNIISPIGSGADMTHMGFVIPSSKGPIFREASSVFNKVTDVPLIAYLRGYLHDPTVLGIHLEKINVPKDIAP